MIRDRKADGSYIYMLTGISEAETKHRLNTQNFLRSLTFKLVQASNLIPSPATPSPLLTPITSSSPPSPTAISPTCTGPVPPFSPLQNTSRPFHSRRILHHPPITLHKITQVIFHNVFLPLKLVTSALPSHNLSLTYITSLPYSNTTPTSAGFSISFSLLVVSDARLSDNAGTAAAGPRADSGSVVFTSFPPCG